MLKRIWCYFKGHRPRRPKDEGRQSGLWTVCGHCRQLMVRGYYGWQRATRSEEAAFKRALARQKARKDMPDPISPEQTNDRAT